jgi:hypothetical protein
MTADPSKGSFLARFFWRPGSENIRKSVGHCGIVSAGCDLWIVPNILDFLGVCGRDLAQLSV